MKKFSIILLALAATTANAKVNTWVLGADIAQGNKCYLSNYVSQSDMAVLGEWVSKNDKTVERLSSSKQASVWQQAQKEANRLASARHSEVGITCGFAVDKAKDNRTEFNQLPPMQQY